jgi:integrase
VSLYRRKGSPFWYYRFEIAGREFRGSTQSTSERDARRIEREQRAAAQKSIGKASRGAPLTFGEACESWWSQVGQHLAGEGAANAAWSLDWLKRAIGPGRRLLEIDDALVAELVARRRAEQGRHGRALAPATVNRSVAEPLRKVLLRAQLVGKAEIARINWRLHLLKEPKERPRELSAAEEARTFAAARADYAPLIAFAILTGCRQGECIKLAWGDIDWGARAITIRGKGGKIGTIPLPPAVRDLLWELRCELIAELGVAELPDTLPVFSYRAARTRDGREQGARYPLTASGVKTMWRRLAKRAGLTGYRWHDHRHTAGTRVLRACGNLKIVKELLRHSSIETTLRYAHVLQDDVAAAMQRAAEQANAVQEAGTKSGAMAGGKGN